MPLTTKQAKIKLSKIQWHNRSKVLGNKKLGVKASKNALGFYSKVATLHARIANIRQDTTHSYDD